MREIELYKPVSLWLKEFLRNNSKKTSKIVTEDVHNRKLSSFILNNNVEKYFNEYTCYDIKVDVAGLSIPEIKTKRPKLAIVEVKRNQIFISDFSQILGYAKIVQPDYAIILSPNGWSSYLHRLIFDFKRYDILKYNGASILIGKWDISSQSIKQGELLAGI